MAGQRWNDADRSAAGDAHGARASGRTTWPPSTARPTSPAGDWAPTAAVASIPATSARPPTASSSSSIRPTTGESSTAAISSCSTPRRPLGSARSAGLPPDWVDWTERAASSSRCRPAPGDTTSYGYDAAAHLLARRARPALGGRRPRPTLLQQAGFLRDEVAARRRRAGAVYSTTARALQDARAWSARPARWRRC